MGVGECLRDATGLWIMGFDHYIGEGTALEVELWAIMLGLKIISQLPNISRTVIETDSSSAIELVLHASPDHHLIGTIINNYRYLLSKLEDYRLIKGSREQKRCANSLAKEGRRR